MTFVTTGIVIRRAEYKDFDRMITVFSPDGGRMDVIARACRRPKSRLLSASELFCSGEFVLRESKGRNSLVQCDIKDGFYPLREDLARLTHACYYLTLADSAALPGQGAAEVYLLLMRALAVLAYSDAEPALVTLGFEARYMPLMGYAPRTGACSVCGAPIEGDARFDAALGGAVCPSCPSAAPRMPRGARRIIEDSARGDISSAPIGARDPDWRIAARLYRPFVLERIERRNDKVLPELP